MDRYLDMYGVTLKGALEGKEPVKNRKRKKQINSYKTEGEHNEQG